MQKEERQQRQQQPIPQAHAREELPPEAAAAAAPLAHTCAPENPDPPGNRRNPTPAEYQALYDQGWSPSEIAMTLRTVQARPSFKGCADFVQYLQGPLADNRARSQHKLPPVAPLPDPAEVERQRQEAAEQAEKERKEFAASLKRQAANIRKGVPVAIPVPGAV